MTSFYPKPGAARQNINNNIAYTGGQSSVAGSTFSSQTYLVRVKTNISGFIKVDGASSISATTNDMMLLSSDPPEVFQTVPGGAMAFISTSTSSGTISCQELC
jgi:hypothetical protein